MKRTLAAVSLAALLTGCAAIEQAREARYQQECAALNAPAGGANYPLCRRMLEAERRARNADIDASIAGMNQQMQNQQMQMQINQTNFQQNMTRIRGY